ncbi:hypothetical protein ACQY0O_000675 [Thecaphora frezii]
MRINRETVLVGKRVVLVPYRRQHVPIYHEWMQDPTIQQQTASEPLTLEQEYEMQQTWARDEDKLTFIILAQPTEHGAAPTTSVEELVKRCKMVGDVNIFFNDSVPDGPGSEDSDDETELDTPLASPSLGPVRKVYDAECEIMIADQAYRRQGLAREALQLLFHYVTADPTPRPPSPLQDDARNDDEREGKEDEGEEDEVGDMLPIPASWLTCKISTDNHASIGLFTSLGFVKMRESEVWNEVEMRLQLHPCDQEAIVGGTPVRVERWRDVENRAKPDADADAEA